jgi:hypothetical protein
MWILFALMFWGPVIAIAWISGGWGGILLLVAAIGIACLVDLYSMKNHYDTYTPARRDGSDSFAEGVVVGAVVASMSSSDSDSDGDSDE